MRDDLGRQSFAEAGDFRAGKKSRLYLTPGLDQHPPREAARELTFAGRGAAPLDPPRRTSPSRSVLRGTPGLELVNERDRHGRHDCVRGGRAQRAHR